MFIDEARIFLKAGDGGDGFWKLFLKSGRAAHRSFPQSCVD